MKHIKKFEEVVKNYPMLEKAAEVLPAPVAKIEGRDPKEILRGLRNPEKANIALLGEPGSGKAIANHEWLPVADDRGYIRMGDVVVGDKVFDENGEPIEVTAVYPQGMMKSYKVTFSDGSSVICNDEHIWHVRKDSGYINMTLKELMDTNKITSFEIPVAKKYSEGVTFENVELLDEEYDMTCIRVDSEKHLFLITKDQIVTHNTAYVQGFAYAKDSLESYLVLEVNPEKLIGMGEDQDTALLVGFRRMLEEVGEYAIEHNVIMVLFIDEFHKIAMLSPSLIEAMKPMLEKSAVNNFRLIAATTFEEYNTWIALNRALDDRFLKITLAELPREVVLKILHGRVVQHGVSDFMDEGILELIYDESKEVLMSKSQPRASLDILNSMIGDTVKAEKMVNGKITRTFQTPEEMDIIADKVISRPILKRVIQRAHSIDIDNSVDTATIERTLKSKLFNQDQVIDTVMRYLEMAATGFAEVGRPKFSFLSTGTTGTGKTELAKIVSETMRIPLKRFDMSRYSNDADAQAFADDLFMSVWAAPNAYLLIDEVEKSSRQAMNILLQVLDDARLTDSTNPNRIASFTGSIINLTTNLGSEVLQNMNAHQDDDARIDTEIIYKALADADIFETAVLGRIDAIVPFRPLPQSTLMKIAQRTLDDAIDIAETNKRRILVSDDIIEYIVKDRTSNDTERGGARDAKRNVRNLVVQKIAEHISKTDVEVPIIIHLDGEAKFKYSHIADVMNAEVALTTCHPLNDVRKVMAGLENRSGRKFDYENLFLRSDVEMAVHLKEIVALINKGYNTFRTHVDDDKITLVGSQ